MLDFDNMDLMSMVVVALALLSLTMLLLSTRANSRLSIKQESGLSWLKYTRLIAWGTLSASQAALMTWHWVLHGPASLQLQLIIIEELSATLSWLVGFLVLLISWTYQGSLPLLLPSLASSSLALSLLASAFRQQEPDIALGLTHALQTVLMLMVLVIEIVISHHIVMAIESGEIDVFDANDKEKEEKKEKKKNKDPSATPSPSRWTMAMTSFKFVLPSDRSQRLRLMSCFLLLGVERAVNLAVPILFKQMIDKLSHLGSIKETLQVSSSSSFVAAFYPWAFLYLAALLVKGGSDGFLSSLRDIIFIPVSQSAFRRISLDVFGHLLDLDHHFHAKRKTGQIMRILDRGTSAIQDVVAVILFNVFPQILDIIGACTYLAWVLDGPWISLIVLSTIGLYIPVTLIVTERRAAIRKTMNALDNQREGRAIDVLLNYETVKLFVAERRELSTYDQSIRAYQTAEYWQLAFVSMLSILQFSIIWAGTAGGVCVAIQGLVDETMTLGDLVLFITIIQQLYVPLTQFGSFYRQIQKALVDLENMFALLVTQPRVCDLPQGKALLATGAAFIRFDSASFSYKSSAPIVLRSVSFELQRGRTLAIVGSTGSGKSTIIKLLLRFYDVSGGSVSINGQDVRSVSLSSLRKAIGVVPQDVVLFNATISENIRYGKMDASDEEVVEASELAAVHESISRLKKGFSTKVGERGVRLSGGEKQRVGMARALIKKPSILVLDEATSSVDSITEMAIQSSLSQMRMTKVIVAHRLSTIIDADSILVLDKGLVAQFGSHSDLVEDSHGIYHSLWSHQQVDHQAANSPDGHSYKGGASDEGESDFWGGAAVGDSDNDQPSSSHLHLPHTVDSTTSVDRGKRGSVSRLAIATSSRQQDLEEPLLQTEDV